MALQSMTGYGFGSATTGGLRVSAEISSVNRKQLDIHLRLPRELQLQEPKINAVMQQHISRGRIHGEVKVEYTGAAQCDTVKVNRRLAEEYIRQLKKTADALGLESSMDATVLLKLPEVVTAQEREVDADLLWDVTEKALMKALRAMIKMRKQEGDVLLKDIMARVAVLKKAVIRISRRAPAVTRNYRKELLKRIELAGIDLQDDENRLLKEVALFADRSDISEELTRLDSHIQQAESFFKSAKPIGRTLDFLAQEMFREINTIGSKGNDAAIARDVVVFKSELERFREQVQNIE